MDSASIRWVGQGDGCGCSIAVLAMVLGVTYEQIESEYPANVEEAMPTWALVDQFLAMRGFAIAPLHPYYGTKEVVPWPPDPFAPVHICDVAWDVDILASHHAVVLLRDGTVLDPQSPEPKTLRDYPHVFRVAGVIPFEPLK